jgi:3-oxoacyl-[acyl-carrier protein] reductase
MENRVVVVTGAASGIGAATARRLGRAGATLALVDRNEKGLSKLASEISGSLALVVDIADPHSVEEAFASVVKRFGTVDGLAHIAGIDSQPEVKARLSRHISDLSLDGSSSSDFILHITDEFWREMMSINLDGTFYCLRAVLRHMLPRRSGAIVTVASLAGITGVAGLAHYSASKGGVIALTRAVAREVAGAGIRINSVAPGSIDTPMRDRTPEALLPVGPKMTLLGRVGRAEEIASAIEFLLDDDSGFIIGETINVNGGAFIA